VKAAVKLCDLSAPCGYLCAGLAAHHGRHHCSPLSETCEVCTWHPRRPKPGKCERQAARTERRAFFQELVELVRNARAAARRCEVGLAIELLSTCAFEIGIARERYGARASVEMLRRAILKTEHALITGFAAAPTDTATRIALAIFRAGLGERKGPKRAALRLLPAKAEVAS